MNIGDILQKDCVLDKGLRLVLRCDILAENLTASVLGVTLFNALSGRMTNTIVTVSGYNLDGGWSFIFKND